MDKIIFGKTVDERIEDFQSKVAIKSMGYGLVVILMHHIMSTILRVEGTESFTVSMVVLFIYIVTLYKNVLNEDVHGGYGAFSYRGVYFPIDLGEDKTNATKKLENKIKSRMVKVSVYMYLVGNFAFKILNELHIGGLFELIGVLLVILLLSLPITALYMHSFVKMSEEYQVALTAPIIGLIYGEIRQENGEDSGLYPRYLEWFVGSKIQRKRDYPELEREYYSYVEDEIQQRMEEVRVVKSGLMVINHVDEGNREEVETRIRELFWKDGHDVHVDLEELIKFREQEQHVKEDNKEQPEEVEEYDLTELEGKESDEQEELEENTDEQEDVL